MANEIVETKAIEQVSDSLYKGVSDIIDNARQEVVVYVNKHSDLMFWHIGHYINEDMGYKQYSAYGSKILATLSQTLTWSHFLELVTIEDNNKRLYTLFSRKAANCREFCFRWKMHVCSSLLYLTGRDYLSRFLLLFRPKTRCILAQNRVRYGPKRNAFWP